MGVRHAAEDSRLSDGCSVPEGFGPTDSASPWSNESCSLMTFSRNLTVSMRTSDILRLLHTAVNRFSAQPGPLPRFLRGWRRARRFCRRSCYNLSEETKHVGAS